MSSVDVCPKAFGRTSTPVCDFLYAVAQGIDEAQHRKRALPRAMPPKAVPADSTTVVNSETADAPRCRRSVGLETGWQGFPTPGNLSMVSSLGF